MADWDTEPSLSQTYSAFVSSIRDRDVDLATMFNGAGTNQPDHTIRWNAGSDIFQIYSSATTTWSTISPGVETLVVGGATNSRTLIQVDVYTASTVWTKPTGCNAVEVWCIGGGAGGGAAHIVSSVRGRAACAGGGGGGSMGYIFLESGINAIASVAVGAGGDGGQTVSTGTDGDASWWQNTTVCRGLGGFGGLHARSSAGEAIDIGNGGSGQAGGNGDLVIFGADGDNGMLAQYYTASSVGFHGGTGGAAALWSTRTGRGGVRKTQFLNTDAGHNGADATTYGAGGQGGSGSYGGGSGAGADLTGGDGKGGLVIVKSYT